MAPLVALGVSLLPELAKWIAGDKVGKIAGQVADVVKSVVGTDDPGAIEKAIATDPAMALQLRLRLADIANEAERRAHEEMLARIADVASARQQTIELARAGSPLAWGAAIVSIIVTTAFGVVTWLVFYESIPTANRDMALYLVGQLSGFAGMAVAYWLGSSKGSAAKDDAIRSLSK